MTDPRALENLSFAALLHDLGKSRIPEYIRKKPTRLTDSERRRMQTHAAIGAEMAGRIVERFRTGVAPIIHGHHENWDGGGYPDGIAGEAIPLGARVVRSPTATTRSADGAPIGPIGPTNRRLAMVRERAGSMYDPAVVRALPAVQDKVADRTVRRQLRSRAPTMSPRTPSRTGRPRCPLHRSRAHCRESGRSALRSSCSTCSVSTRPGERRGHLRRRVGVSPAA